MAYELTKNSINSFNEKYGTSVSFGDIKSQAKKLGSYNQALRAVFLEAYKQVALKDLIDHDTDFLKSPEMFQDFNKWITNNLIDETVFPRIWASSLRTKHTKCLKRLGQSSLKIRLTP